MNMSIRIDGHHKDQLLDVLMYYADPDMRARLMRQVPEAYNAYCIAEGHSATVEVRHLSDYKRVRGQDTEHANDAALKALQSLKGRTRG